MIPDAGLIICKSKAPDYQKDKTRHCIVNYLKEAKKSSNFRAPNNLSIDIGATRSFLKKSNHIWVRNADKGILFIYYCDKGSTTVLMEKKTIQRKSVSVTR